MASIKNPAAGSFDIKDPFGTNIGSYDVHYDNSLFDFTANLSGAVIGLIYHFLVLPVASFALWIMGWIGNPQRLLNPLAEAYHKIASPILDLVSFPLVVSLAVGILLVYLSFEKNAAANMRSSVDRIFIGVVTGAVSIALAANPFAPAAKLYEFIGDATKEIVSGTGAGNSAESSVVATFLMPVTQMLNFGTPLNSQQSRAWSEALNNGTLKDFVESNSSVSPGFGFAAAGIFAFVTAAAMLYFAAYTAFRMGIHLAHVVFRSVIIPWTLLLGIIQRRGFDTVTKNIGELLAHAFMVLILMCLSIIGPGLTGSFAVSITRNHTNSSGLVILSLIVTAIGFVASAWVIKRVSSNTGVLARALRISSKEKLDKHYATPAGSLSRAMAGISAGGLLANNGDAYDPAAPLVRRAETWLNKDADGNPDAKESTDESTVGKDDMINNTPMFADDGSQYRPHDTLTPTMTMSAVGAMTPAQEGHLDEFVGGIPLHTQPDFAAGPVAKDADGAPIFGFDEAGHYIYDQDSNGRPVYGYSEKGNPIYGFTDEGEYITGFTDDGEPHVESGEVFTRFADVPNPEPRNVNVDDMTDDEAAEAMGLPSSAETQDPDEYRLRVTQARSALASLVQVKQPGMTDAAVDGVAPEVMPEPVVPDLARVDNDAFVDSAFGQGVSVDPETGNAVDTTGEVVADRGQVVNVYALNKVALPEGFPMEDGQPYQPDNDPRVQPAEGEHVELPAPTNVVTHEQVSRGEVPGAEPQPTTGNVVPVSQTTEQPAPATATRSSRAAHEAPEPVSTSASSGTRLENDRKFIDGEHTPESRTTANEVRFETKTPSLPSVEPTPIAATPIASTYVEGQSALHSANRIISAACGYGDVTPVSFDDPSVALDFDVVNGENVAINPNDIGFDA